MKDSFNGQTCATKMSHTNRHLELLSNEFIEYLVGYEQWLRVLGYASSTVYYFPSYLRSFMHFLEEKGVMKVRKLNPYT